MLKVPVLREPAASKGRRGSVRGSSGQALGQVAEAWSQDLPRHALDLLGHQDIGREEEGGERFARHASEIRDVGRRH